MNRHLEDRPGGQVFPRQAAYIRADRTSLCARRDRALSSVRLSLPDLASRIESGTATADEWEAWDEVDVVNWLLYQMDA